MTDTVQEERLLSERRRFRDAPADVQPLRDAGLDELNQELFREVYLPAVDITSADREIRRPDYPLVALQQIVRNAVMYRLYEGTNAPVRVYWYSDRVEIISPGGPFGQVTPENFGRAGVNDYRNPHLAEAMRCLGYAQHFGVGIQIARDALARNGNPPLEFRVDSRTVVATIRRSAGKAP